MTGNGRERMHLQRWIEETQENEDLGSMKGRGCAQDDASKEARRPVASDPREDGTGEGRMDILQRRG
jgi:hypothetical protein